MLSKSVPRARTAVVCLLLLSGCRSLLPWSRGSQRPEHNLAFVVEKNLLRLTTAEINGRRGRFYLASASQTTLIDRAFTATIGAERPRLTLTDRRSLPLIPVTIDLQGIGDAFIGAEPWSSHAITIDYRKGLVTYQEEGIHSDYMTVYPFSAEPAITILVNGREVTAVVDTALPDSLVLPRGQSAAGRAPARVEIAGTVFPSIDVTYADVSHARIGNRLLEKFLVTIDYGRRQVGLWRDPRISLE